MSSELWYSKQMTRILPLILAGLFAVNARAEISVNLVVAQGPGSLTKAQVDDLFNAANMQFTLQMGQPLVLREYRFFSNPFAKEHTSYSKRLRVLRLWQGWFRRHPTPGAEVNFAITPPFTWDNKQWMVGYSGQICSKGGQAYATGEATNEVGTPRLLHSQVIFMHELGHIVGGTHEDSNTIMHADALSRTDSMSKIRYSNQSSDRIKQCIKNW
jgi:hypothetical protein